MPPANPKPARSSHDWERDKRPLGDCLRAWAKARGFTRAAAAAELRLLPATYDSYCYRDRPVEREGMIRRLMTLSDIVA